MSVPLLAPTSDHATVFACSLFRTDAGVGSRRPLVLVGHDTAFVALQNQVAQFADADSPVLILGETGTGKELVARALHLVSPRRVAPFVCTNCAQYQDASLAVSQLFRHRKGSFTGAAAGRQLSGVSPGGAKRICGRWTSCGFTTSNPRPTDGR